MSIGALEAVTSAVGLVQYFRKVYKKTRALRLLGTIGTRLSPAYCHRCMQDYKLPCP